VSRDDLPKAEDARAVLITGGAGFIGANIADRLAGQGHRVLVYDALMRPGVERNLAWLKERHGDRIASITADIRDEDALAKAVLEAKAVFHMAAQVAVTTSMATRATTSPSISGYAEPAGGGAAAAPETPVIFASTNKVYGDLADIDFVDRATATCPPMPVSPSMASARRARSISTRLTAAPRARPTSTSSTMRAASACAPPSSG
jgi:CDP-paratose 2-epimerase